MGSEREVFDLTVGAGTHEVDAEGRVWRIGWIRRGRLYPIQRKRAECRTAHDNARLNVQVQRGKRYYATGAHRLVYYALVGAIPDGTEINHIDGNPRNNRPGNLEITTPSENQRHAAQVLGHYRGQANGKAKLTTEQVYEIRARFDAGESQTAIAADYGITRVNVGSIGRRETWNHLPERSL